MSGGGYLHPSMRSIFLCLSLFLALHTSAQTPQRAGSGNKRSAATTPQQATRYLLDVIASGNSAKGSFQDIKGTQRRTETDGTKIFNVAGLKPFGTADQYLMFYEGSYPSFVAEFAGAECDKVVTAITEGLPAASPAGTYGFKLVENNESTGRKKYALTKGGKSFAIFLHDLKKQTGMFVLNGKA